MAKWIYTGDESLVFPTLGLTVSNGDVFEGPADLSATGVALADAKAKVSATAATPDVPVADAQAPVDATPNTSATVDAPVVSDAPTAVADNPTPDTATAETN